MYSLISAPVLGFDLTRADGGSATAELLETMLAVPPGGWTAMAGQLPAESPSLTASRAAAFRLAHQRPSVRNLPAGEGSIALLYRAPIGTLAGLLHCVRTDVLVPDRDGPAPTPVPAQVAAAAGDAVCATYLRELLTDHGRRELVRGWLALRQHLPASPVDLGPQERLVHRLLVTVRSLRPAGTRTLAEAADRMRAMRGDWARAMHSLTWAVHMSGRVRAAATVQLRLVQAVDLAGIPLEDRAMGVWNLLSGAAQALVVRDFADADSAAELLSHAVSGLGASWLLDG